MSTNDATADPGLWVEQHGDYLFRYAMFRLRDVTAAEDAVQETLLAALQARDKFEGRGSERTWLVGILKHKVIDHLRRLGRMRQVVQLEEQAEQGFDPFAPTGQWAGHWKADQAPADWQVDAATALERKEFWETLDRCLAELPTRTAMAFTLREIDGLSSQEVCDVLNISLNNLWVMLHRARLQLRHAIEAAWFRGAPRKYGSGPAKKLGPKLTLAGVAQDSKYLTATGRAV